MPRARSDELEGYMTSRAVAEALGLTPYLVKSRIASGALPQPAQITGSGVMLFDEAWVDTARARVGELRSRRRAGRRSAPSSPSPRDVLGHAVGEDRWLPSWDDIHRYFVALGGRSDRVLVEEIGPSTRGKPYIAVFVSAAENLTPDALRRNRALLAQLWDPGELDPGAEEDVIAAARTVGIILATQHSNEVGAALMTMTLAHELSIANDPRSLDLLANTITILIPSHNPDGVTMVADWYARWLGTEFEGSELPHLYHPYVGHDNNRDWFMQTQVETQHYVTLHNREHPQAVFDMHQMGRFGPRYMVPPFIDPLDPNQDPVIQQGFAALGSHVAQRLTAAGKQGVVTNAMFDNYSPSLAYGNYHGSVDLLSEAASARLATPVDLKPAELSTVDDFDPSIRTWNQPLPWRGGHWALSDIVEYNLVAARAFLDHLSCHRDAWLRDYLSLAKRASSRTEPPYGYAIPGGQRDPRATDEMIRLLQSGLVRVDEAMRDVVADGITFPAGTLFVSLDQHAGPFAKTLLEVQIYPDLRKWPDGPPRRPYDAAGHTLPLQMGVAAVELRQPLRLEDSVQPLGPASARRGTVTTAREADAAIDAWAVDARSNAVVEVLSSLLARGVPVSRARTADTLQGVGVGDLLVNASAIPDREFETMVSAAGASATPLHSATGIEAWTQSAVRIGVYQPWTGSIDEGWARWVLEEYGVPYSTLHNADIRQGGLRERVDTILIPEMTPHDLREGRPERNAQDEPYPPEFVGGLGVHGLDQLRQFVDQGGSLVVIDRASRAIIDAFALPVANPLGTLGAEQFYCPGSLLRVVVDSTHPLGLGLPRETVVMFLQSMAFRSTGAGVTLAAIYPSSNPNVSGWILGSEHLEGAGALAEVTYGAGRVILFGFRPYFRAQARGTYRLFFNALFRSGLDNEVATASN